MFLGQNYNVDELPEGRSFDPIPAGWYTAMITDAEIKDTSSGGKMIALQTEILGPAYANCKVFDNINIVNRSPKAEEIARATLGDICRAGGLRSVQDTDQLRGISLQIKVSIEPERHVDAAGNPVASPVANGKTYEAKNGIKSYKAIEGSIAPSAPQASTATVSGSVPPPPWASKK